MPTALKVAMNSSARHSSETRFWSVIRPVASVLLLAVVAATSAGAQANPAMQPMATRAELTALAERLGRGSS